MSDRLFSERDIDRITIVGGSLAGLRAAFGVDAPRRVMPTRKSLLDRASCTDALTATADLPT